ncbi:MAG TPA: hypothetical protein VI431_13340 [Candidatus Acidoferrum sp.]
MDPLPHVNHPGGLCGACGAVCAAVLRPYKWSKPINPKSSGACKTVAYINHWLPDRQESGFWRGGSAC